jgi:hypothetical protein
MRELLPSSHVKRWTPRRKAQIVDAVARGHVTPEIVFDRYRISREEFLEWERLDEQFGISGLKTTLVQSHRKKAGR